MNEVEKMRREILLIVAVALEQEDPSEFLRAVTRALDATSVSVGLVASTEAPRNSS